jgi:hypothetical protein
MPSIIYSEYDLEEVLSSNNNNEDERNAKKAYINININKQKFESEDMINALRDLENKINLGENNVIKEENENMEITHYNNIVDQRDEEGNLVNNKNEDGDKEIERDKEKEKEREKERDAFSGSSKMERKLITPSSKQEALITLTGKAVEINHNVFTEKSNKDLFDLRSDHNNNINDEKIDSMRNTKTSLMKNSQKNFRSDKSPSKKSLQNVNQNNDNYNNDNNNENNNDNNNDNHNQNLNEIKEY